jgi:DNA repair protein SbcC/Rad50
MKLDKLIVHRLPGIPHGFTMENKATVGLIIGPNGSGKSSLCRAIRNLLWTEKPAGSPFSVEAFFTWDKAPWKAVREEGTKTRWFRNGAPAEAPSLPGDHVARCYKLGVLDLILPAGGEVELQLAAVINQEMSGGVNLTRISDDVFSFGSRLPAKRLADLQKANTDLNALLRNQKQLSEKESELVNKKRGLEQSKNSAATLALLEVLKRKNKVAVDLKEARLAVDSFAEGQDKVHSEDADTLASLLKQKHGKKQEARQIQLEIETTRKALESRTFPADAPDSGLLTRQVDEACVLQAELHKFQEDLAGQEKILEETRRLLDSEADDSAAGPQPGRTVYADLFKTYAKLVQHQGQVSGLQTLRDQMDLLDLSHPAVDAAIREKLQQWLEIPEPQNVWISWVGLVLGLTTAGLGFFSDHLFLIPGLGLAVCCLGLMIKTWKQKRKRSGSTDDLVHQLREAGLKVPNHFTHADALQLLVDETGKDEAKRTRRILQDFLSGKQQDFAADSEQDDDSLRQLRRQHGLAMDRETPELINLMNAIPVFRDTKNNTLRLKAEIETKQQALDSLLAIIGSAFAALGFNQPSSTLEARNQLEILSTRMREWEDLQREQKQFQKDLDRVHLDLNTLEESLSAFWKKLDLTPQDDNSLVRQLVDDLPGWQQSQKELTRLQHEFDSLELQLRENPDLLDPSQAELFTPEEIEQKLRELRSDIQARDSIRDDISRTEYQVEQARDGLQMAETLARVETARTDLRDIRKAQHETTLGRLLLEDVKETYQHTSRPRVLATASDSFRDFTQGRYQLRVVAGENDTGRFAAFDTGLGENVGLGELSDGTRAQLLLAVRLAFIRENEGSVKPPIFLDESLTSSDPHRFAAIADRLARWAGQQERQIFYLSSNPNDARAWQTVLEKSGLPQPEVFDLGKARSLPKAGPVSFEFETPTDPPSPAGMSAAEYASLLSVPGLDPWQPNTEAHLWYLLNDDLSLLHRLLMAAAPRLGQWLARKSDMATLAGMTDKMISNLEARGHCLDAFLRNWRIGRERPLTVGFLEETEIVGESFKEKCRSLLQEVDGSAEEFLAGLRNKKVPRFQTKNIELLENYFIQESYLDPRKAQSGDDLLGHVLTVVAPEIDAGHLEVSEVRMLVQNWQQSV